MLKGTSPDKICHVVTIRLLLSSLDLNLKEYIYTRQAVNLKGNNCFHVYVWVMKFWRSLPSLRFLSKPLITLTFLTLFLFLTPRTFCILCLWKTARRNEGKRRGYLSIQNCILKITTIFGRLMFTLTSRNSISQTRWQNILEICSVLKVWNSSFDKQLTSKRNC